MFRLRREINLDNNATTPLSRPVVREMTRVLHTVHGNASSLYHMAQRSALLVEEGRADVAEAIGARPDEIVFTGCASEANNTVIKGLAEMLPVDRKTIVATPIEHASTIAALEYAGNRGVRVRFLPVDRDGRVRQQDVERLFDASVGLVCCMLANNELGTVQDVAALSTMAHRCGAFMMSDCVQALGKIPLDVTRLGVDYASFSAHKIHGPKGIGALFVKEGSPFQPLVHGGGQESGRRGGTEALHNIAGFAAAARGVPGLLAKARLTRGLQQQLLEGLREVAPGAEVLSPVVGCLPNTVNMRIPGKANAFIMAALDAGGIAVSSGSACHAQGNEPSHVLTAVGRSAEEAREAIRVSLSAHSTRADVRRFLDVLDDIVQERVAPVTIVLPQHVTEDMLDDPGTYVLDVRFPHDRALLKSLPGSHETSLARISEHQFHVPRHSRVLVVCQAGLVSPFVAFYLRRKGYRSVSILGGGALGWKLVHPAVYERRAGDGVTRLTE